MSSVAEQLRAAREGQNLTVYQVADVTKIKTDHVRALEEGNYDMFPAPVYIRGFIRTYAALLKLDVPQIMVELETELAGSKKFSHPPSLSGPPRGPLDHVMYQLSKLNWRIILPFTALVVILLAAIFGYRAWRNHKTADPLVNLGPGLYQPPQKNSGELLPLPTNAPARK